MKFGLGSSAFVLCLSLVLSLPTASASAQAEADESLRAAQIHLGDLGFYKGYDDGLMGTGTRAALRAFQKQKGLQVTGKLDAATLDALVENDFAQHTGMGNGYRGPVKAAAATTAANWRHADTRAIPIRFGTLVVEDEQLGNDHRYTLQLNGKALLPPAPQAGQLRITQNFELQGEDAVIITAYRGETTCTYKNYLLLIPANGSPSLREMASCAGNNQVRLANNALFISFPATMNKEGWSEWDVWRYENARLVRL